jgi:predicted nucleic acid-binding protein
LNTWLVDTGPLVAYLDRSDPAHDRVAAVWDTFTGQLASTSAVVTECMHFLARHDEGPVLLAGLVAATGMLIYDYTQAPALRTAAELMRRYATVPMDFADATLVLLAEDLGVTDILTLDRRGFTVFRTRKRRHFRLLP